MNSAFDRVLETCITKLERGELTSESLREAFKEIISEKKIKQSILVLLAGSTSLYSTVHSMFMYENGVLSDGPVDSKEWPYQKVSDAIDDGWRLIQFPTPPAIFLDQKQRFVPCEFVLEKIVEVYP
ncbi:hypothetical protein [Paenibacillus montanisoli]|uniref:Uncharacterized protein n=1 Tax=Paenibacillus montanisoli TaxID=2081970 RepID=A0A328U755_9BACL|nr:hypothetical protein [Paenibacillus montanisoli]RAP77912.1 hypothetical protein DL346_05500 [Paenibacillus montanisoli]